MDSRKRTRWNRKRKRHSSPRNNEQAASSSSTSPSSNSASADNSIPGFYYDSERRRYFRILPEHLAAGSAGYVTPKSLERRDREARRQNLLQLSYRSKTTGGKPKMVKSGSISSILGEHQLGLIGRERFQRAVAESRLRFGDKEAIEIRVPDGPSMINRFKFLEAMPDGKTMFGWGVHLRRWSRQSYLLFMNVDANGRNPYVVGHLGRDLVPLRSRSIDRFVNVQSVRVGDHDAYAFSAVLGYMGLEVGHVRSYFGFFGSPFSTEDRNRFDQCCLTADAIVWSCVGTRDGRIIVGVEGRARMIDFRPNIGGVELSTGNKDPLVLRFSKDENELFMGLRASVMKSYDMRTLESTYSLDHENVCSLYVMDQDPNYIVAGNFSGQIKLWDLRMRKSVRTFNGQVNSHTKLPLIVNEEDSLVIAGGEDGTTRCWSLQTGEMLREIPSPHPVNEIEDIPAICYSNRWGGKPGNAAIVLGAKHELYFHKI